MEIQMNKKINLAVASAALVLGASAANAGIVIPAGEWTMDINGNVNAYASTHNADDDATNSILGATAAYKDVNGESDSQGINTGLLPSWLGFTGTTRQNDLDVSFTISMQPNASDNGVTGDSKTPLNRQAFLTFGDKSWGTVKLGKDLGIFASDAILNDMTLLGVGSSAITGSQKSGGSTSLGGIGTGYIYPAWKGQVAYTTPNMNGFQATIGITNPNQGFGAAYQDQFGYEGKASYDFAAGDAKGKVWVSGAAYDVTTARTASVAAVDAVTKHYEFLHTLVGSVTDTAVGTVSITITISDTTDSVAAVESVSYDATIVDIGANINLGNFGLTGYYYSGEGVGTTFYGSNGATAAGLERDSDGGYVQATFVIPTGTKLGASYGVSKLDLASGEAASSLVEENKRWTVGAYHPLTKHLNLVAEYNKSESESHSNLKAESDSFSLGAILFF
jgi:predicted porin